MRFVLWAFSLAGTLELLRFLRAHFGRRAALDPRAFPADPAKAARLSPESLASADLAERSRVVGLGLRGSAILCLAAALWFARPRPAAMTETVVATLPAPLPDRVVGDGTFSASVPAGWVETWKGEGLGARYTPVEPGGADPGVYISIELKPASVAAALALPARVARSDPAGRREVLDRSVITAGQTAFVVECYGREGRIDLSNRACALFRRSFQPKTN